ncbi:MAG TPA: hypothetical protein VK820_04045 [Steroidobacteraceae bacterium]|nr:hypothetical protein [Steroidobacteraceae bacterium]
MAVSLMGVQERGLRIRGFYSRILFCVRFSAVADAQIPQQPRRPENLFQAVSKTAQLQVARPPEDEAINVTGRVLGTARQLVAPLSTLMRFWLGRRSN